MEEGSSKMKKRKRGRSLIFKSFLPLTGSSGEHDNSHASDDNLVYCDISNNRTNGDPSTKTKSSSSSRGRMSSIFKAVLFDTAMKKKKSVKKTSKNTTLPPTNSSSVLDEKTDNLSDENNVNVVKVSEADNNPSIMKVSEVDNNPNVVEVSEMDNNRNVVKVPDADNNLNVVKVSETNNKSDVVKVSETDNSYSNNNSNVVSLPRETDASAVNTGSQMSAERKVMSRVNSSCKKPPLPSVSRSRSQAKRTPEGDSKPATSNNSTSRLCILIVLVVFVSVILWMSFTTNVIESSNIDSDSYTNKVVVGDEL